jgi:hypothetical protein
MPLFSRHGEHPPESDAFQLLARLAEEKNIHLSDPTESESLLAAAAEVLSSARAPNRLHGQRAEEMFRYVVAGIGEARAIKGEDAGEVLAEGHEEFSTPDFRVVLLNGEELFVEVKNFNDPSGRKPFPCSQRYLSRLARYGELFGRPVYLATYWRAWRQWTLHKVEDLLALVENGRLKLTFIDALPRSEMRVLGDFSIATKYPLSLRLLVNAEFVEQRESESTYNMVITGVELRCAGTQLHSARDKEIAFGLMVHGRWPEADEPEVICGDDGSVQAIEFSFAPEEPYADQPFAIVAPVSTLMSTYFDRLTVDEHGVRRLHPGSLPPSPYPRSGEEYKSKELPLWLFILSPNALPRR